MSANITVIREPRIYMLGRTSFDPAAIESFLSDEHTHWTRTARASEPEEVVEIAGRVCYMSFGAMQSPRQNEEYISNLIRNEHDSVLEHATWTFLLSGVSRAFTHQLVRHRVGFSFSQMSQQYHDESDAAFVLPAELLHDSDAEQAWLGALQAALDTYRTIGQALGKYRALSNGSRKEAVRAIRSAARTVLPNATETKIVVTANARALRHFLRVRGAIVGDIEMRRVAFLIYAAVSKEAPSLFQDFHVEELADGFPIITCGAARAKAIEEAGMAV
ncbi:MAG: FAD-dependent thymidylate synthase [Bryobacteraceae bacterium]